MQPQTMDKTTPGTLNLIVSVILLAIPVLLLLVSSGGSTPYHIAAVIGLACLAIRRPRMPRALDADERMACLGFAAFTAAVLISLVETGFRRDSVRELDVLLRPLWAIPILFLFIRVRMAESLLWFGVALGAIAVGLSALYEYLMVDHYVRADGATSAVTFGNTALLMGIMSAIGIPYFRKLGKPWIILPAVALMLGLLASLLSGTRGGWVALPALVLLLLWHFSRTGYAKASLTTAVILAIGIGSVLLLPQTGVTDRVELAVTEFNRYVDDPMEHGDTSVGTRLALWHASWNMFLEQPVFGGGIGHSFNAYLKEQVALGNYHPTLVKQTMPHNVFLDTLALQGIVGLAGLFGLWGALGMVFVKAVFAQATELRTLGAAGLALLVGYALFGLTDSVMGYGPPLVFFCLYAVLIVYLIAEVRQKGMERAV
ncbi:O-antigen ligase family protein [Marinobacter halotolerans]|uniref:O-antigen ligase family protein n=1 Tax=Marinobacter halotolerans TaxID=1569211 RepID=UPI001244658B|nr:O-antigen ligase family protein [Marinobacter halotolerans]